MKEISAVSEAQNKLDAIRSGLINGDIKIKASDLAAAQNELQFAELQQQAAIVAKQKNAESQRRTTLLNLQKELAAVSDSRKSVDAKFAAFQKSLADYLTSASNYQNSLDAVRNSLRSNEMHPGETVGIVGGIAPGQSYFGISVTDIRRKLEIGEVSAENVLPEQEIKPLIEASLGEYNRHF
jgi:multidrug efflux pump subunit AcrA (membrane-fusion protein)